MVKKTLDGDHKMAGTVIKGAAGVAFTATAVVAGVALANKKNRQRLGRRAKQAARVLTNVAQNLEKEGRRVYPIVAHQIKSIRRRRVKKLTSVKRKRDI